MMRLRLSIIGSVLPLILVLAASCGGSSDTPDFPQVIDLGGRDVYPSIMNSSLAVGENRVSMSLIDRDDNPVLGASVHLRYYNLNGGKPQLRSESDARFIPIQLSYVDEQSGGAESVTGDGGMYVSYVDFDQAGDWGVEISIKRGDDEEKPIPYRFNVIEKTDEPSIGDPAPPSVQMTLANVSDIAEIDSSFPPRPSMHDTTIADAVRSGKPTVIAFATPAFCRSRLCNPVMDTVMDPLAAKYGGQATFIHVEPYLLRDLRDANIQNPVPPTREWRIASEPWVFVVDRQGRIVAKFEGVVAPDEVESALAIALESTAAAVTPAPSARPD